VSVARVYEEPAAGADGGLRTGRVLVDRLWPRGLTKERADLDLWLREIAPSRELRTWYAHDAGLFTQFRERYLEELVEPERARGMDTLREYHARGPLLLLTATRETAISHATVLAEVLAERPVRGRSSDGDEL
jgi:uncharacterized protein YeaO (DUF488 family)